MEPKIVMIGGGGHARSCIDVVEAENRFAIAGIVAPDTCRNMGYTHLGSDHDLTEIIRQYRNALIGIGQIRSPHKRVSLYKRLKDIGADLPVIISPKAHVSARATIADSTIVMHGAVVNTGAEIGSNCIINSLALVEHDANIGAHCHVSTGARVNGGVQIGSGTFIGSGAIIHEGISIGSRCVVAAGSVVRETLQNGTAFAGNSR